MTADSWIPKWRTYFNGSRLGHGRKLECLIVAVMGTYGLQTLFFPETAARSIVNRDLFWLGYARWLALPSLLIAVIGGLGLYRNVYGLPYSRPLRVIAALIGTFVWTSYGAKYAMLGLTGTLGFHACFWCAVFSPTIIRSAWLNLPAPGAPGAR